ncbi:MAG: SPOR domain-containing protein, partial [Aquabacterium sp.]
SPATTPAATTEPPAQPTVAAASPDIAAEPAAPRRGWWLQLGAFRQPDGAAELRRQVERGLETLSPLLAVFSERGTHRLQAGPWPTRDEALAAAARLRETLNIAPALVERR